jgi:hypothetical protein
MYLQWAERHWGRFALSTAVSPATYSFHQLLHSHHHISSRAGTVDQKICSILVNLLSLQPTANKHQVPPKRRFLQEPHGVTSQKTPFFIFTAVETSNLTNKQTNKQTSKQTNSVAFSPQTNYTD